METIFLISVIVGALFVLTVLYRLNSAFMKTNLNAPTTHVRQPLLRVLNHTGLWFTVAGIVLTGPLIIALIFTPDANSLWIAKSGVAGCLSLSIAALCILSACIGLCIAHQIPVKRVLRNSFQFIFERGLKPYGRYIVLGVGGVILLALVLPYLANFLTLIFYAVGLLIAFHFGLLDPDNKCSGYFNDNDFMKEGADYDFYNGTNEYNTFPE